jgi:predicted RNA binding protein YcfA (HicA-like mRNA interferase family)
LQPYLVANHGNCHIVGFIKGGRALTRHDKLVQRLKGRPSDFTWDEVVRLLRGLGYKEVRAGRTAGSRRRFARPSGAVITLHKPHPGNKVKGYVVDRLITLLSEEGLI